MKEEIKLWMEFNEDQSIRRKARNDDPLENEIITTALDCIYVSSALYNIGMLQLNNKYGIVDITYENFMNWLAQGQPKFKGVEIKHEVKQ